MREIFLVPTSSPKSWDELFEMRDGIPFEAWKSVSQTIANSTSKVGKTIIHQGPNTKPSFPEISSIMDLVSRAFPSAKEVAKSNVFIYNFKDRLWANDRYQEVFRNESARFKNFSGNAVLDNCPVAGEVCWAMAFTDSQDDGVMLLGVIDKGSREHQSHTFSGFARSELGLTIAHEYLHTIQRKMIGENWFRMQYGPPIWFNEGAAVFVENAVVNHLSYDNYMRFRAVDSKLAYPGCEEISDGCFKVDRDTLERFFKLSNYENNWGSFPYGMKYEVSARIIEMLVALKGPESLIRIYEEMAQDRTFDVAFERVFGIPYAVATPIIAKVLVDQFESRK
jgi:hypothetical protein